MGRNETITAIEETIEDFIEFQVIKGRIKTDEDVRYYQRVRMECLIPACTLERVYRVMDRMLAKGTIKRVHNGVESIFVKGGGDDSRSV
jgi:hypothetical protein